MAYAGIPPASFTNNLTNVQLIDDISGSFNGSTQTFALTSSSTPFHAVSARSLIVVLGGIVQKPQVDYTVDGSNITFTTAPAAGITFAARNIYGLNYLNNVNDGVITPAKLSTGAPTWNTGGTVTVSGDLNVTGSFNSGTQGLFWGDNEPANFGNDNDLQIYHDGSHSRIKDNGTGSLISQTSRFSVHSADDSEAMIDAVENSYVKLYFDGASKLETSSTGITVSGDITCTNSVGIGTTNPVSKLEVKGNIYISNNVGIPTGSSAGEFFFGFTGGSNNYPIASIEGIQSGGGFNVIDGNDQYGALLFKTSTSNSDPTEKVRITSSGDVGIGTTSPTTKLELQSSYTASATNHFATFARDGGAINAVIGYNAVDLDYMYVGTGTAHPFGLRSNNTLALYIDTNQKVGIGTASPSGLFHVANTGTTGTTADNLNVFFSSANRNSTVNIIATNTEASAINFGDGDSIIVGRIVYSHASDYMAFSANTAERIRITSSGNVGIGTTNPSQKLDVRGSVSVHPDSGDAGLNIRAVSGSSEFLWFTEHTVIDKYLIGCPSGSNDLVFRTGAYNMSTGLERIRFTSDGNVGIGETNPQSRLNVRKDSSNVFSISNYFNPSTNSGIHVRNQSSTAGAFSALTLEARSSQTYLQNTSIIVRSSSASNYVPQGVSFTYSADSVSQKYWMDWTQEYGITHQNFNLSWTYYNGDNVARTFTWLNVFNQIYTGSSGRLIRNGYAYKFYLFGSNGRHLRIYEGVVHIGDIDTYGASSSAINVSSIAEIPGPYPDGCSNPFSSVSTTGFTYQRQNCNQVANVSLMALNNRTSIETITGTP